MSPKNIKTVNYYRYGVSACLTLVAGFGCMQANAASLSSSTPSIGEVIAATPGLQVSGDLSASYSKFSTDGVSLRAFDNQAQGFTFNQVGLSVSDLPQKGAGLSLAIYSGEDAKILRQAESWPYNSTSSAADLYTAYAQYAMGANTLMVGKLQR